MSDSDEEFTLLSDEARADAAPVVPEVPYIPRAKWKPGPCLGFIVNTSTPVARLRWPRGRERKDFFARIKQRGSS
jgi:hypothetical protein